MHSTIINRQDSSPAWPQEAEKEINFFFKIYFQLFFWWGGKCYIRTPLPPPPPEVTWGKTMFWAPPPPPHHQKWYPKWHWKKKIGAPQRQISGTSGGNFWTTGTTPRQISEWDIWWQNSELLGPPPVNRQTENITFPQTSFAGGKNPGSIEKLKPYTSNEK